MNEVTHWCKLFGVTGFLPHLPRKKSTHNLSLGGVKKKKKHIVEQYYNLIIYGWAWRDVIRFSKSSKRCHFTSL